KSGLKQKSFPSSMSAVPMSQFSAVMSLKFQSLQSERETCLASNCALAKENLALRPRLENSEASLAVKYQELRETREACREKQRRTCLGKGSPRSALSQLRAELDAAEEESEAQVERFLGRELPLDAFLEFFQRSRTLAHLRRTQAEKLEDLLQKEKPPPRFPACCAEQRATPLSPARAQAALVQNAASPKLLPLCYGYTPALLVPSEAIIPFPMPVAPPHRNLPPLGSHSSQPPASHSSRGSPLRFLAGERTGPSRSLASWATHRHLSRHPGTEDAVVCCRSERNGRGAFGLGRGGA
uniref:VPS37 C-terminal domain-containing protein n=1 Tax=Pelusios castaneus TaxID=367368 RepID=A0A8C8SR62_9SAUR